MLHLPPVLSGRAGLLEAQIPTAPRFWLVHDQTLERMDLSLVIDGWRFFQLFHTFSRCSRGLYLVCKVVRYACSQMILRALCWQ